MVSYYYEIMVVVDKSNSFMREAYGQWIDRLSFIYNF